MMAAVASSYPGSSESASGSTWSFMTDNCGANYPDHIGAYIPFTMELMMACWADTDARARSFSELGSWAS